MEGQDKVVCPNCGSNRVKSGINIYKLTSIISALTIIGVVFIPFIYMAYRINKRKLRGNRNFRCISCLHLFKVSNETYYEYKKIIS